jgi:hypothetical protein
MKNKKTRIETVLGRLELLYLKILSKEMKEESRRKSLFNLPSFDFLF